MKQRVLVLTITLLGIQDAVSGRPVTTRSVKERRSLSVIDDQGWAWAHRYHITPMEAYKAQQKRSLSFVKTGVPRFTQLIPSWNSARPSEGCLVVSVRIRDARTKQWSEWHKVADWSAKRQTSYFNKSRFATYTYARLELLDGREADGFEMKMVSLNGASLEHVSLMVASTSHKELFKAERIKVNDPQLTTVMIEEVPVLSQLLTDHPRAGAICSPTALTAVIGTFCLQPDIVQVADYVYDWGLNIFGNWMFNTAQAHVLSERALHFYPMRLRNFAELHGLLRRGFPVAVSLRGKITGAAKTYPQGHLLVVVGWDARSKKVICHDSAFKEIEKVRVAYDIYEFINAWELSNRLVYKPLIAL